MFPNASLRQYDKTAVFFPFESKTRAEERLTWKNFTGVWNFDDGVWRYQRLLKALPTFPQFPWQQSPYLEECVFRRRGLLIWIKQRREVAIKRRRFDTLMEPVGKVHERFTWKFPYVTPAGGSLQRRPAWPLTLGSGTRKTVSFCKTFQVKTSRLCLSQKKFTFVCSSVALKMSFSFSATSRCCCFCNEITQTVWG